MRGPLALETTDYTARLDLTGLPPDREVFVRVMFEDLSSGKALSEPLIGRFRTPPASRRDVTFAWSGDTAGQGWGINKEWGGMKCYEAVRREQPGLLRALRRHDLRRRPDRGRGEARRRLGRGRTW